MDTLLVFDVDGTLTGPRRRMHEDFTRFFKSICRNYPVFLVSGSDMEKLEQQLPREVIDLVAGIFPCSGNEMLIDGQAIYRMEHFFPDEVTGFLAGFVDASDYGVRTGKHLEQRIGTLNVSVVGRNADPAQRLAYFNHDGEHHERKKMIEQFMERFPEYEANVGGQISVDITPRGWNKSRVFHELTKRYPDRPIAFFGDNMQVGGNDRPLGDAIQNSSTQNKVYPVDDHYDTWKILQDNYCISARAHSNVA